MIGEVAIVARVSDAMMSGRVAMAMTITMTMTMCTTAAPMCAPMPTWRSIFISRGLLVMCGYGWRRIGRGRQDRANRAVDIF